MRWIFFYNDICLMVGLSVMFKEYVWFLRIGFYWENRYFLMIFCGLLFVDLFDDLLFWVMKVLYM